MDIRQMKYFLAVVQEGQITKAAERLHLAQPALSMQIKQMEAELEVQLFERHGRHLEITEGGNMLRIRAEQMIALFNSATQELRDMNKGQYGILSIGTLTSSDSYVLQLMQRYIVAFHKNYPEVTYQMWAGDTFHILELLNKDLVEIGIVRTPVDPKKYNCLMKLRNIPSDPMVAVYSSLQWDIDSRMENITIANLKDKPLILHRRNEQKITDICRNHGFEPKIFCVSDDIRAMLTWSEMGFGVTLLTNSSVSLMQSEHVRIRKLDEQTLESKTALIWRKGHYLSAVARNFIKIAEYQTN